MISFAPVAPIHILEAFNTYGILGDYHLLLAHDVVKHPEAYKKLFGDRTWEGTVILDNSVVELKEAVSLNMVLMAAEICRPTVVVLPDVYEKQEETILACDEARNTWKYPLDKLLGVGKWTFMYVPQGLSLHSLIYCAQQFSDDRNIGWWGIPRNVADNIGSRLVAAQMIHLLNPIRKMHMLGFSNNVVDDIYASTVMNGTVSGIDSAVPIRCASLGLDFVPVFKEPLPKRGKWWDSPKTQYVDLMSRNLLTARLLLNPGLSKSAFVGQGSITGDSSSGFKVRFNAGQAHDATLATRMIK